MEQEAAKQNVSEAAADLINDNMIVGLGTGSTVFYFIRKLIKRCQNGLKIQAVPSSSSSAKLAKEGGISLLDPNKVTSLHIMVDGADEVDTKKRMIKGKGGALLREKILTGASQKIIIVVDETKKVRKLGAKSLAVEISPFAYLATIQHIQKLYNKGSIRKKQDGSLYLSDNKNFIYDIQFDLLREKPEEDHIRLLQIPGVLETGFFFFPNSQILIGKLDGNIQLFS